jgi:hypothetical protein
MQLRMTACLETPTTVRAEQQTGITTTGHQLDGHAPSCQCLSHATATLLTIPVEALCRASSAVECRQLRTAQSAARIFKPRDGQREAERYNTNRQSQQAAPLLCVCVGGWVGVVWVCLWPAGRAPLPEGLSPAQQQQQQQQHSVCNSVHSQRHLLC